MRTIRMVRGVRRSPRVLANRRVATLLLVLMCLGPLGWFVPPADAAVYRPQPTEEQPPAIRPANLTYGNGKTTVCFSDKFLSEAVADTNLEVERAFTPVELGDEALFEHPFAVMSGEGSFTLSKRERAHLTRYLLRGGFVIASAGCSSKPWNAAFAREMTRVLPESEFVRLDADHPVFHSVYDITRSAYKSGSDRLPDLRAIVLDGRVVMIWSPDGLNDTANAGGDCCCCGGNEVKEARRLNVNILAYALTH